MKKVFFLATIVAMSLAVSMPVNAQTYIDLGLPSGTQWKTINEDGFIPFYQALSKFGDNIPSKTQWEELIDYCDWKWTGRGYRVVGPNNQFIFLPADGIWRFRQGDDGYEAKGVGGLYYSSTVAGEHYHRWILIFEEANQPQLDTTDDFNKKAFSTRLVKNPK